MRLPNELLADIAANLDTRIDRVCFATLCKRTLPVARQVYAGGIGQHPLTNRHPTWIPGPTYYCYHSRKAQGHNFGPRLGVRLAVLLKRHRWLLDETEPGWCLVRSWSRRARHPIRPPGHLSTENMGRVVACSDACAQLIFKSEWCEGCTGVMPPKSVEEWLGVWMMCRYAPRDVSGVVRAWKWSWAAIGGVVEGWWR